MQFGTFKAYQAYSQKSDTDRQYPSTGMTPPVEQNSMGLQPPQNEAMSLPGMEQPNGVGLQPPQGNEMGLQAPPNSLYAPNMSPSELSYMDVVKNALGGMLDLGSFGGGMEPLTPEQNAAARSKSQALAKKGMADAEDAGAQSARGLGFKSIGIQ